jgi:hypothetical protein
LQDLQAAPWLTDNQPDYRTSLLYFLEDKMKKVSVLFWLILVPLLGAMVSGCVTTKQYAIYFTAGG